MEPPLASIRSRLWSWFQNHAQSPHALVWLALVAFSDAVFLPIAPEVFLVALMLAHPPRWRQYLATAIPFSIAGAAVGYYIAHALFYQLGVHVIEFYGLQHAFELARQFIHGHVFLTMMLANFGPVPDKMFIYAGGFLGVNFVPFITGYAVGRGIRLSVAVYLTGRYGAQALDIIRRYFVAAALAAVVLGTMYAMVHWHLLGL